MPDGQLLYAIGDIHGRLDLLRALLRKIESDIAASSSGLEVGLAFLGDYIDRGPESCQVIDLILDLQRQGGERVLALKGNHEAAMLDFLADPSTGPAWADHGGRETLASYGVAAPRSRTDEAEWAKAREALAAVLPPAHLAFLRGLELIAEVGDYVFVHAGVRPGVPLDQQAEQDLMWIRKDFIEAPRAIEHRTVVHGHTPTSEPAVAEGRIGVDTGAYATGILTALRLEGDGRSFIQTGG